jgi:dTDP-4-dehydrorhamnose reductase
MTILLFGKDGQVGFELQRALAPLGALAAFSRQEADLADPEGVARLIGERRPEIVVNAAAYTAVDKAEEDEAAARTVNRDAVAAMAEACRATGTLLVHYSTDYVFDGTKDGRYTEDDATNPLGVYGRTKLEGEEAVRASGADHLIFRASWVYGRRGRNFAATMLRLAREREELRVVADQIGAPTSAELIADVTALCLARRGAGTGGTYHLAAGGETSWHGYARHVLATARDRGAGLKAGPDAVLPIATAEFPTPARRPANSRLDTGRLERDFSLAMPDWRHHLDRVLGEWLER